MEYITVRKNGQEVRIPAFEFMPQERFSWKERRMETITLAKLYKTAGFPEYSERAATCATFLEFGVTGKDRKLQKANFCHLRLCPMCTARRAKRAAYKLSQVLDMVEREHKAKFIFLTLTMKNVDGAHLGQAIAEITAAWYRFVDQQQIARTFRGWFRAIEITRGDNRYHKSRKTGKMEFRADNGYHVHIHSAVAVDADYFSRESRKSGKYLNQSELIERWQKALRVDYRPSVQIEVARGKSEDGKPLASAGGRAALESAKYAVKDSEYIDQSLPEERLVEILTDYTHALYRRRLTAFGGWMKDAAKRLDAENLDDGDLVHTEDTVREDVAELIETFNWHFGVGDYVLARRELNPLRVKREA